MQKLLDLCASSVVVVVSDHTVWAADCVGGRPLAMLTDDGRRLPPLRAPRPRAAWPEPEPEPEQQPQPAPGAASQAAGTGPASGTGTGTGTAPAAAAAPLLHALTKEPLFLPAAATAATVSGPPPTVRYRVHFKRVAIRSGPSRDDLVIGALVRDFCLEAPILFRATALARVGPFLGLH